MDCLLWTTWEYSLMTTEAADVNKPAIQIRPYQTGDEIGWLRCRVLAFLDTAYFDNVLREKEQYQHPAIELVAETQGQIVGLMDVELEDGTGMLWHIAVHPDFRRRGIASRLLEGALSQARAKSIKRLEAWTRDDAPAREWYFSQGFRPIQSYWHVYMDGGQEMNGIVRCSMPALLPVSAFAHYVGDQVRTIKDHFKRVHECCLYELML